MHPAGRLGATSERVFGKVVGQLIGDKARADMGDRLLLMTAHRAVNRSGRKRS